MLKINNISLQKEHDWILSSKRNNIKHKGPLQPIDNVTKEANMYTHKLLNDPLIQYLQKEASKEDSAQLKTNELSALEKDKVKAKVNNPIDTSIDIEDTYQYLKNMFSHSDFRKKFTDKETV